MSKRPLVAHVVYRFDTGGLENGVVNLINRMDSHRHAVIALTEIEPSFAARVRRDGVPFIALRKPPGHGWKAYGPMMGALRQLQPDIVHTRNLAALELQLPSWCGRVAVRVHGEHGRDVEDMQGLSLRHRWMRRAFRPFVQHYVALSRDLAEYLQAAVGVPKRRISQIYNGVDQQRFTPADHAMPIAGCPFAGPELCLVGTVGRMQSVKAQPLLAQAFAQTLQDHPDLRSRLRLVLVGDGPLRAECEQILQAAGVRELAWLPGERGDIPEVMRGLDVFALPSLAEGISNTILEAMASGLPVTATAVGGNADLVDPGVSGHIVPAGDVTALALSLQHWARDREGRRAAGQAGRRRVEDRFSLDAMVRAYEQVYTHQLSGQRG